MNVTRLAVSSLLVTSCLFITAQFNEISNSNVDPSTSNSSWVEEVLGRSFRPFWVHRSRRPFKHPPRAGRDEVAGLTGPPGPLETRSDYYGHRHPPKHHIGPVQIDFSPLFVALIPISLFLGAAAALTLATVTTPNTAVASVQQQQQQQQQEDNNNNNNANNVVNSVTSSSFTSPFIFAINSTAYGAFFYGFGTPYLIIINNGTIAGRSNSLSLFSRRTKTNQPNPKRDDLSEVFS